jgi:hypothetical protein
MERKCTLRNLPLLLALGCIVFTKFAFVDVGVDGTGLYNICCKMGRQGREPAAPLSHTWNKWTRAGGVLRLGSMSFGEAQEKAFLY